jgi:cell shape-determining protein MreC
VLAVVLLQTPLFRAGGALSPFDRFFTTVEDDAMKGGSWIMDRFAGFDAVRTERDLARAEADALRAERAHLIASIPDYELLRDMRESTARERIVAGVLSVPNETPYDTIVLDKGERDGVKKDALAFSETGRPLGTIVEVRYTTSLVMLFTTPGTESMVYSPRERVFARAIGLGAGSLMVQMPHGSTVAPGDPFIMPTISGELIGTVARTWSDPAEPGVLAAVTSSSSLRSLRFVSVDREPYVLPTLEDIRASLAMHATSTAPLFTPPPGFASSTASSTP